MVLVVKVRVYVVDEEVVVDVEVGGAVVGVEDGVEAKGGVDVYAGAEAGAETRCRVRLRLEKARGGAARFDISFGAQHFAGWAPRAGCQAMFRPQLACELRA